MAFIKTDQQASSQTEYHHDDVPEHVQPTIQAEMGVINGTMDLIRKNHISSHFFK